jgi:hypothetical protein
MSYQESDPRKIDTDGDGIFDNLEDKNRNGVWEKDKGETKAYSPDSDGDDLWDGYDIGMNKGELTLGTDPLKADTSGDGYLNTVDSDDDNDCMDDQYEIDHGVVHRHQTDTGMVVYSEWQNPYIYNARYVIFIGGEPLEADKKGVKIIHLL